MRAIIPALLCLAGCTLATDATDRKVDPSLARDLDYTFTRMDAHASTALDIVLASAPSSLANEVDSGVLLRLRTHARIVLPPIPSTGGYPDEHLHLDKVMDTPGAPHLLLFYADTNDDNTIQYGILRGVSGAEHIWREQVPPSGVGLFEHSTNFVDFREDEYTPTGDVVLNINAPAADWRPPPCANGKDHVLEVRVTIAPGGEAREIGYYRNYGSNPLPAKSIALEDIADQGNLYQIDVLIDGVAAREPFTARAPDVSGADLVIPQTDWYPPAPTTAICD